MFSFFRRKKSAAGNGIPAAKPEMPAKTIEVGDGKFFVAPSSMGEARVAALLPTKPSEDASHLLGVIDVPTRSQREDRDYLPCEKIEWVITANFAGLPRLDPKEISLAFDKRWREKFGGFTGFGKEADTGRWTYLISANSPTHVTDLKLAWHLDESKIPPCEGLFQNRLSEVQARLSNFGNCSLTASLPFEKATPRAEELAAIKNKFSLTAILKLSAPAGTTYGGKAVWDTMLCLGLKWGDMDCFHWQDRNQEGEQSFFSVETTTPPGYFLPEQIAAGRMNPADLVFCFSIPRSAAPRQVFHAMARAAEYCRTRLGGTITTHNGSPIPALADSLAKVEEALAQLGFPAGSSDALRLF